MHRLVHSASLDYPLMHNWLNSLTKIWAHLVVILGLFCVILLAIGDTDQSIAGVHLVKSVFFFHILLGLGRSTAQF